MGVVNGDIDRYIRYRMITYGFGSSFYWVGVLWMLELYMI